jgi:hypothetical protein
MRKRSNLMAAAVAAAMLLSLAVISSNAQAPAEVAQAQGQGKGGGRGKGKARPPSRPTPHWPDGRVNFGPLPGEKGVWAGNAGSTLATNDRRAGIDNGRINLPTNLKVSEVPFQPWAKALYEYRQERLTADDPHVRCKASGGPRLYHTPYGFEIVDAPEMQQVFVMGVGGPHTWRVFYMDGRKHPADLDPSYYGNSIGHWEGETLVVDTIGFNERFWFVREGLPHTEQLHLIEKFSRPEYDTLRYEVTVDDPGAYTKQWSGGWAIPWNPNDEVYEYMCQENNRDVKHMYGGE